MTTPLPLLLARPEPLWEVRRSMLNGWLPPPTLALRPDIEPMLVPLSRTPAPAEDERRICAPAPAVPPGVDAPEGAAGAPSSRAATRSASVPGVEGVAGPGEVERAEVLRAGFMVVLNVGVSGCIVSSGRKQCLGESARLNNAKEPSPGQL